MKASYFVKDKSRPKSVGSQLIVAPLLINPDSKSHINSTFTTLTRALCDASVLKSQQNTFPDSTVTPSLFFFIKQSEPTESLICLWLQVLYYIAIYFIKSFSIGQNQYLRPMICLSFLMAQISLPKFARAMDYYAHRFSHSAISTQIILVSLISMFMLAVHETMVNDAFSRFRSIFAECAS